MKHDTSLNLFGVVHVHPLYVAIAHKWSLAGDGSVRPEKIPIF